MENQSINNLPPRDQDVISSALKNKKTSKKINYGKISQKKRNESYTKTINRTQNELSPFSRIFSKIIHIKIIEIISDFLAKTIARPNALLTGSVVAFLSTLFVYILAKNIGFQLSGFETLIAFIIGWIIGIIYDYFSLFTVDK